MARPRSRPRRPTRRPPEASDEPAAWANHFEVGYNAFEFLFDFGQDFDSGGAGPQRVHTRIVTAPAYAKLFRGLLDRSIGDYEAVFGPINAAHPAATPAADDAARRDEGDCGADGLAPTEG
jgi:hypothetical protein